MKEIEIIGVQERRELAILTRGKFNDLISDIKQNAQHDNQEIVLLAAKKLGISVIQKQIKDLENKIEFCKNKIKQLGFDEGYDKFSFRTRYIGNESIVDNNTPAGKIYYNVAEARPDVKALEEERDRALQEIWMHPERKKIQEIVTRKVNIKMLTHEKK